MNFDYSIETASENIQNAKTRQYFQEVYQTFINKNYRSSIVMLYSVLICDLVFKLRDLRDIYSDSNAEKILKDIEDIQEGKKTSPEWESKLIEFIKIRTNLLESSDIVAIESLQKYRHLSAHPILNNSDLLFTPNRETAQSLIRSILEGILTNPPFFSNKIFDTMLNDLVEVKDSIFEYEALEKYVVSRYLNRLKNDDFHKVFRSLWKIVFISTDELSKRHNMLLYKVLRIFTSQRKTICIGLISNETNYYSNINKDFKISSLIHFLARYPDIYLHLDDPLKLLIEKQSKDEGTLEFISWFLNKGIKEHFDKINIDKIDNFNDKKIKFMETISKNHGNIKDYCNFLIEYFCKSKNYDQSNKRLRDVASCLSDNINLQLTNKLLELSNSNSQIYKSWSVPEKIKEIVKKFEDEIDKTKYENIYNPPVLG